MNDWESDSKLYADAIDPRLRAFKEALLEVEKIRKEVAERKGMKQ